MRQIGTLLLPLLLPMLVGCVVAAEGEEPFSEETTEQTSELEMVQSDFEIEPESADPTIPHLDLPELQGVNSEIEDTNRPDPDPWQNGAAGDPFRPDPDPWKLNSDKSAGKGSSGAKD